MILKNEQIIFVVLQLNLMVKMKKPFKNEYIDSKKGMIYE